MAITRRTSALRLKESGGFSLIEVLISMGILTVVIGATLAGMSNMMTANEMVLQTATMNNSLRTGMDLIIRDLLQVGSGLPSGHTITIPNGAGSIRVKIPGPPGTNIPDDGCRQHDSGCHSATRRRSDRSTASRRTSSRC